MTFESTFCSSPWFHMRLTNNGGMNYCRWSNKNITTSNIKHQTPLEFFRYSMQSVRDSMIQGQSWTGCNDCRQMELHGKISGRQKQLLKIGVQTDQFARSLRSSPWLSVLDAHAFDLSPQDWQVDLGNHCNSACVFCDPGSSSRLAAEQFSLGLIDQMPDANWANDPVQLNRFFETISASKSIKYMHFLGGETLITPAFAKILQHLIDQGLHQNLTIGFTTNLTVWPQSVIDLLLNFDSVHVGLSIEAFAPVNEYVRWPAQQSMVESIFERWIALSADRGWYNQIRSTPTLLSIPDLLTLYDKAWQQKIIIESCNFLQDPAFLRPSVLPNDERIKITQDIRRWLEKHDLQNAATVTNIRNPTTAQAQIWQDLSSYVAYLENEPDESHRLGDLVQYLKRIESVRHNCVLNYRPEYEKFLRAAGY